MTVVQRPQNSVAVKMCSLRIKETRDDNENGSFTVNRSALEMDFLNAEVWTSSSYR